MLDSYLVQHCAPTLAGLKTGCLFPFPYTSAEALTREIRLTNQRLRPKGMRLLPLRLSPKRALLYLYRPRRLTADLSDSTAAALLHRCGYSTEDCDGCVVQLARKLRQQEDFPHEIGLFLGYPPEDVCGFIENRARCYKCVGCWKVYGDADAAQRKFAQFDKCTRVYCHRWANGANIDRLAVAG